MDSGVRCLADSFLPITITVVSQEADVAAHVFYIAPTTAATTAVMVYDVRLPHEPLASHLRGKMELFVVL